MSMLSCLTFALSVFGQVPYDPTPFDVIGAINGFVSMFKILE